MPGHLTPASSSPFDRMRILGLLRESIRSGTIASLAMMPLGFLFKSLDLRVGHYGPKLAGLMFDEPTRFMLFAQHLVIGWVSALPLLIILPRVQALAARLAVGASYGVAYYIVVNSFALPLLFGDPTPWQLGLDFVYPSLLVHLVFGTSIGLTAGGFVATERKERIRGAC